MVKLLAQDRAEIRDMFAGMAMSACISTYQKAMMREHSQERDIKNVAILAYKMADAMLSERDRLNEEVPGGV